MDNPRPQGKAAEQLPIEELHWQAEREMADALSTFQSQVEPAAELTLLAVVQAAKPAFRLGFSFSVRSSDEGTTVLLLHRSGAQQSAEIESYDADFQLSARLLAGLLGIPVECLPRPSKAEETDGDSRSSGAPAAATSAVGPEPALTAQPVAAAVLDNGAAAPEPQALVANEPAAGKEALVASGDGLDPALEPLSAEEISSLTAMLRELARSDKEGWRRFSTAFRRHFKVPRTARTITDRITQRRHGDFIDHFGQKLAAAAGGGGNAAPEAI